MTFAPDAYLGVHHHVGPGIRYVLISGEVTFTEGGQSMIYKAGEYFFETGNLPHTAQNQTNLPLRILFVEILPNDWAGRQSFHLNHNAPPDEIAVRVSRGAAVTA